MQSAFISYSQQDRKLAKVIADSIRRLGGRVWIDEGEMKIGDSLIEKIRMGIDNVDLVIALVSKHC